jgi:hypothetical protein
MKAINMPNPITFPILFMVFSFFFVDMVERFNAHKNFLNKGLGTKALRFAFA